MVRDTAAGRMPLTTESAMEVLDYGKRRVIAGRRGVLLETDRPG